MRSRPVIVLVVAVLAGALVGIVAVALLRSDGEAGWTIHDLGTLGGQESVAYDVNEKGQVVGESDAGWTEDGLVCRQAFLWQDGEMRGLRANRAAGCDGISAGWVMSTASSIDGTGRIVGKTWNDPSRADSLYPYMDVPVTWAAPDSHATPLVASFPGDCFGNVDWDLVGTARESRIVGTASVFRHEDGEGAVGCTRAGIWAGGRWRDIGTLGGGNTVASDVNERGQVVGQSTDGSGAVRLFVWQQGVMRDLGLGPGPMPTAPPVIDDRGDVAGTIEQSASGKNRAFVWRDGKTTVLPLPAGTVSSLASAINAAGHVVGTLIMRDGRHSGFFWDGVTTTELAVPRTVTSSSAVAISGVDLILGTAAYGKDTVHAVVWENGKMTDLGTLGGSASQPVALSERGQVVGWSTSSEGGRRAVLWSRGD